MGEPISEPALLYTLYVYMDEIMAEKRTDEERNRLRRGHDVVLCDPRYPTKAPLATFEEPPRP